MIYPRCKINKAAEYIDSDGYYYPCCWIANQPYVDDLKEFLGEDLEELHTQNKSIQDLRKSKALIKLENSWDKSDCFYACKKFCSKNPADIKNEGGAHTINEHIIFNL